MAGRAMDVSAGRRLLLTYAAELGRAATGHPVVIDLVDERPALAVATIFWDGAAYRVQVWAGLSDDEILLSVLHELEHARRGDVSRSALTFAAARQGMLTYQGSQDEHRETATEQAAARELPARLAEFESLVESALASRLARLLAEVRRSVLGGG